MPARHLDSDPIGAIAHNGSNDLGRRSIQFNRNDVTAANKYQEKTHTKPFIQDLYSSGNPQTQTPASRTRPLCCRSPKNPTRAQVNAKPELIALFRRLLLCLEALGKAASRPNPKLSTLKLICPKLFKSKSYDLYPCLSALDPMKPKTRN